MADLDNVVHADFSRKGWVSGTARCVGCKHEWIAVVETGTTELECPECGAWKGVLLGTYLPAERWECGCECDLFRITRTGATCINCGTTQEF